MSVYASIDIHLSKIVGKPRSSVEIIQALKDFGWGFSNSKYIAYLPLGDKDEFDWQEKEVSFEKVINMFKEKEEAHEIIGVLMTWKDTYIGGEFLFWPDDRYETFTIHLSSNRQTIILYDDYEITDFQYYLQKILPSLNKIWTVEFFEFREHI